MHVNSRRVSELAMVVTDSMFHTSHLSRTFITVQEFDKTLLSFLLVLSIKCLQGKVSGHQHTEYSPWCTNLLKF